MSSSTSSGYRPMERARHNLALLTIGNETHVCLVPVPTVMAVSRFSPRQSLST